MYSKSEFTQISNQKSKILLTKVPKKVRNHPKNVKVTQKALKKVNILKKSTQKVDLLKKSYSKKAAQKRELLKKTTHKTKFFYFTKLGSYLVEDLLSTVHIQSSLTITLFTSTMRYGPG